MTLYDSFIEEVRTQSRIGLIQGLLGWDQEVLMPPAGAQARAETMAWLSGQAHQRLTDAAFGEMITALEEQADSLDEDQETNVREMRRAYDQATKLPTEFVERFTRTCSEGMQIWQEARQKSDFSIFQPMLEQLVDLARQKIAYLDPKQTPYDTLLDDYEVGLTTEYLDPLFDGLRGGLIDLLERIEAAKSAAGETPLLPEGLSYPISDQEAFCASISEQMGFDFDAGRMDPSTHPFSITIAQGDARITTRYDESDPFSCLYAVLHETGHSLYEQGLPAMHAMTPRGEAISLGVHESQSRLWENQIGRTQQFWEFALPRFRQAFPDFPDDIGPAQMNLIANRVEPSFIRVEADEVNYNLHVMLRYEIEKRLFNGDLAVADLPQAWNELFERWFGIAIEDDANGVLQDVHWSMGAFGYFPTYTLGNLYAAQLFSKMQQDLPDIEERIASGRWSGILSWLRERIHEKGRLLMPAALIEDATGKPPSPEPFLDYLEEKYGRIYALG